MKTLKWNMPLGVDEFGWARGMSAGQLYSVIEIRIGSFCPQVQLTASPLPTGGYPINLGIIPDIGGVHTWRAANQEKGVDIMRLSILLCKGDKINMMEWDVLDELPTPEPTPAPAPEEPMPECTFPAFTANLWAYFGALFQWLGCKLSQIIWLIKKAAKTLADIGDYILNLPDHLDVWVSRLFGIEPKKPFWDELSKKIKTMLMEWIDEIFKDYPENKK